MYLFIRVSQSVLEGGNMLETVAGHHPVVVVSCDEQHGRVLTRAVLLDVVQRGDGAQVGELLLIVAAAIVADPGIAHSELLKPEQIHHTEIIETLLLIID